MRNLLLHLLMGLMVAVSPLHARAQTVEAVPEYTMKAAYLYNFALLTAWPPSDNPSSASFQLCLYGPNAFGPALDALNNKEINGQKVRIVQLESPEDALRCQLIFISETKQARISRLLFILGNAPILTVSDTESSASNAIIRLAPENNRLTFSINTSAAKMSNLQLSSKLLRLATRVSAL